MRTRLLGLALGLLAIPTLALADDHRWDLYTGGSGGNGASKLGGLHFSFGVTGQRDPGVWRKVLFVGDVSVQLGSHSGAPVNQLAYSFGARVTPAPSRWHAKPFFQFMGGGVHQKDAAPEPHNGSVTLGGGVDFVLHPEVHGDAFAFRVQVDRFFRSGSREDFWRVSAGLVLRVGQEGHK